MVTLCEERIKTDQLREVKGIWISIEEITTTTVVSLVSCLIFISSWRKSLNRWFVCRIFQDKASHENLGGWMTATVSGLRIHYHRHHHLWSSRDRLNTGIIIRIIKDTRALLCPNPLGMTRSMKQIIVKAITQILTMWGDLCVKIKDFQRNALLLIEFHFLGFLFVSSSSFTLFIVDFHQTVIFFVRVWTKTFICFVLPHPIVLNCWESLWYWVIVMTDWKTSYSFLLFFCLSLIFSKKINLLSASIDWIIERITIIVT